MKSRVAAIAVGVVILHLAPVVSAQTRCDNSDTINCEWNAEYGWIIRGSAPVKQPEATKPEETYRDGPEKAARVSAAKDAAYSQEVEQARRLAPQFQAIFDAGNIDRYRDYVDQIAKWTTPWIRYENVIYEVEDIEQRRERDQDVWGPLFIRAGVACLELTKQGQGNYAEQAVEFLQQAERIGYGVDALAILSEMSTLGLDSSVNDTLHKQSLKGATVRWQEVERTSPRFRLSPRVSLVEREKARVARAEELSRQNAAAEESARGQAAGNVSAAAERVLTAADAYWRAAQYGYPLRGRLPPEREASLVRAALAAVTQYERDVAARGSNPDEVQMVERLKAAAASSRCSPNAAIDCMPLLDAFTNVWVSRNANLETVKDNLRLVECHARHVSSACAAAAQIGKSRAPPEPAWNFAYRTLGCVYPGAERPGDRACVFTGLALVSGDMGPMDKSLANDFFRLGCARGEEDACEKVAAGPQPLKPPMYTPLTVESVAQILGKSVGFLFEWTAVQSSRWNSSVAGRNVSVSAVLDEVPADLAAAKKSEAAAARRVLCNSWMSKYYANGLTMLYKFNGADGKEIYSFTVDRAECTRSEPERAAMSTSGRILDSGTHQSGAR